LGRSSARAAKLLIGSRAHGARAGRDRPICNDCQKITVRGLQNFALSRAGLGVPTRSARSIRPHHARWPETVLGALGRNSRSTSARCFSGSIARASTSILHFPYDQPSPNFSDSTTVRSNAFPDGRASRFVGDVPREQAVPVPLDHAFGPRSWKPALPAADTYAPNPARGAEWKSRRLIASRVAHLRRLPHPAQCAGAGA